jgi:hypothetical protein
VAGLDARGLAGDQRAKDRLVKFLHASEPVADWLRANVGESSA